MTIALKTTFSRLILIVLTGILALLGFWGGVRIVNKIVLQNIGLAMRDADYAYVQKTLSRMPWLLRATDDCNNTLVQLAIESQNPKMVDLMLQLGAERDPTVAVFKDDASTLAQYIDSDRKLLNQTLSCDKYTLLHLSAKSGSTQSAMLLITKGATVDVLCRHEWTPLRYAVFHENDDVAGVLIGTSEQPPFWLAQQRVRA